MRIVAIIPARMAATRFPDKPLTSISGLPMIEHVRRRVRMCRLLSEVVVATCDEEIKRAVEGEGGKVIMTSDAHERCTDRIAEAAGNLEADIIVNVQGDEPLILPRMIEEVVGPLLKEPELPCVNLVSRIVEDREFDDPNAPKVVANCLGDILYISREPIPSRRKTESADYTRLKQLGIIAFRSDFLQLFTKLPSTPLEKIESVDMMRAVEHGYRVRIVETAGRMIGVDVPADVQRVEEALRSDMLVREYLGQA